jgi:hypothetical protein
MSQALDHGVLNVPLAKRGNIDAQIDAYKREQALMAKEQRRAAAVQLKADKAEAKLIFEAILQHPTLLTEKAAKHGTTVVKLRTILRSWTTWEPKRMQIVKRDWFAA